MSRKPAAKKAVLDAYEAHLVELGERSATLSAVAKRAGVSKGGLLYHFPNKEALAAALLDRLDEVALKDIEKMRTAPDGAAAYFLRTSTRTSSPVDRAYVAVTRLAEVGPVETRQRLAVIQQRWLDVLAEKHGIEVAKAVRYMAGGLYFQTLFGGRQEDIGSEREEDVDVLLGILGRLR